MDVIANPRLKHKAGLVGFCQQNISWRCEYIILLCTIIAKMPHKYVVLQISNKSTMEIYIYRYA